MPGYLPLNERPLAVLHRHPCGLSDATLDVATPRVTDTVEVVGVHDGNQDLPGVLHLDVSHDAPLISRYWDVP